MKTDLHKRVAFFVSSLSGGGAERITLNLAQSMAEIGYPVDLVLAKAEGPYLKEVPDSVRLVDLGVSRSLIGIPSLTSLPALVRYLHQEQPQVLIAAMLQSNIVALWARCLARVSTQIVVCEHNTLSKNIQAKQYWKRPVMPLAIRSFYPWADGIVAVSKGVADDLAQATGLVRDRIQVIYNPVVTPEMRAKAQATLEHPWFQPGQPPVILAVGRFVQQKDFPSLIRAFAQVRKNHSARLMILGEGEERCALEALIAQLDLSPDVALPGFVDNPYAYMARAAVFALSSKWEGLPTVLIEALYCGAKVVSTDCPSGPQEILKNGQYGQLVPVGNISALAQSIESALISKKTPPHTESWQPFEQELVVKQYLNLLYSPS
jgi:glycosyltransferase involved in cell wall biosynthesis